MNKPKTCYSCKYQLKRGLHWKCTSCIRSTNAIKLKSKKDNWVDFEEKEGK